MGRFNSVDTLALGNLSTSQVSTTDVTVTTAIAVAMSADVTTHLDVRVAARSSDGTQGAGYVLSATFRNAAGIVSQIGTTTVVSAHEDVAAWDAVLDISGTDVRVRVTGEAAKTITWRATATAISAPEI